MDMKKTIGYISVGSKLQRVQLDSDSVFIYDKVFPANTFAYGLRRALMGDSWVHSGVRFRGYDSKVWFNWGYTFEGMAKEMLNELERDGYVAKPPHGIA